MHRKHSPPPSPPSPGADDLEYKSSRKREREVSTEPVAISRQSDDQASSRLDSARTPAKKNRTKLVDTQEEEDITRSRSNSPPPSIIMASQSSPPHEMKIRVRQISQGVEDLHYSKEGSSSERDDSSMNDDVNSDFNSVDVAPTTTNAEDPTPGTTTPHSLGSAEHSTPSSSSLPSTDKHQLVLAAEDTSMLDTRNSSTCSEGEKEKGLKRKHDERGTSQAPPDEDNTTESNPATSSTEPVKRPRDDSDVDDNPRETKRPSPPPEKTKAKITAAASLDPTIRAPAPTLGGFMSYASTSSPFASVKGHNIFTSMSKSPSPFALNPNNSGSFTPPISSQASSSSSSFGKTKRSGFEAFASSSSPFSSVTRSKSPVLGAGVGAGSSTKLNRNRSPPRRANSNTSLSAFSSYMGNTVQSFAVPPATKKARTTVDGSPASGEGSGNDVSGSPSTTSDGFQDSSGNGDAIKATSRTEERDEDAASGDANKKGPSTFSEKLRNEGNNADDAGSEDEQQASYEEQDLVTGEEDEQTIHQVRGKLFSLGVQNAWAERGTGTLKLNVRRSDGGGARLIMRKEAVYALLLNVTLFKGMHCGLDKDPRYVRFSAIENGSTMHYNLRVSSAKIAQELLEEITINIPET